MRRISYSWYIVLFIWILIGVTFIILNSTYNILSNEDSNLILGLISVGVSIVSLGLATMKNPKFKGKVKCWNNLDQQRNVNNNHITPIGNYSCISFKIDNYNKLPVNGLTINFRCPSNIYHNGITDSIGYSRYEFKNTILLTSDKIKFLGNTTGDSDLVFEHYLELSKWEKNRVIYVTVAGDNILPTTFRIKHSEIEQVNNSSSSKKHILKRVN
jgi:hypothetical protein